EMHQLLQAEQQWRLSFEHSPIGAAVVDEQLRVQLVNDTLAHMLGLRAAELIGRSLRELTGELLLDDRRLAALTRGSGARHECDLRLTTASGNTVWGQATIASIPALDGGVHGLMVQIVDVTARREAELELANRAMHDALTGLPNRNLVHQWLASALDEHLGGHVGVLYCDLDRFKRVNDSLGHAVGDDLLTEAATRLTGAVRPDDFVGRIGGDEFVIVVERLAGDDDLLQVARRIAEAFDEPFTLAGHQHLISISVGTAVGRAPDSPDDVLMRADLALLRAKRAGRARVEVFDSDVDQVTTRADLEFEAQLRQSIDADQLRAYYQRVVALDTNATSGHEALVRWEHPSLGLLSPDTFLPLAENSGVIRALGWWMLFRACHDAFARPDAGWIAVNMSANQLNRPGFLTYVQDALDVSGLAPSRLHLEITETALMHASPTVITELRAVRALGVGVVLDDFGTGYSSLSLLRDLPVSKVKIDRSFVTPLLTDPSAAAIVRAVLLMCADLGLPTVAEGVENPEQLERLLSYGCTHAQGFLFGHPRPHLIGKDAQ
ncbi:MAG: EAL domain-containing protein, partial [Frankiaceae bacterium]|nr:EAL domain-containing protein [Frankiaceae bacterium]